MSITLILNIRMAHSPVCSGLTWRGSAPKRHQWPVVATGQLDSTGRDWGRSERGKDTDQSLVLALIGSGRVYWRKREIRRREEGGGDEGRGWLRGSEVPVLSHRLAESVPVCLSVLTLSKSICPLWNCGQREGRGFQVGWLRRNSSKHNQDTRRTETTSTLRHAKQTQQSENLSEPLNFLHLLWMRGFEAGWAYNGIGGGWVQLAGGGASGAAWCMWRSWEVKAWVIL